MNKKYLSIVSITLFLALLSIVGACKDGIRDYNGIETPGVGEKARVSLSLSTPVFKGKTVGYRAFLDDEAENKVEDFIVCVFGPAPEQALIDVRVCAPEDIEDVDDLPNNGHKKDVTERKGSVYEPMLFEMLKGSTVAIFANTASGLIAPIEGVTAGLSGSIENNKAQIINNIKANFKDLESFRKLKIQLADYTPNTKRNLNFFAETLPMYGEVVLETVPVNNDILDLTVHLKRLLSKVQLNLSVMLSEEDKQDYTNPELSFIPNSLEVINLPANAYIGSVVDPTLCHVQGDEALMYDSFPEQFESSENSGKGTNKTIKSGFSFYALPNTREPQHSVAEYALRDEWIKENTDQKYPYGTGNYQKNIGFKNAPSKGTYVKISGYMEKSFDNNARQRESYAADLTSYVHLGYVGNDVNNYELNPNIFYTYNMEINGIKTIIKEVTLDEETRPGYEGHILHTTNDFIVDSHYDAVMLVFDKDMFTGVDKDKIKYIAFTPYANGNTDDVHWIKFVSNSREKERRRFWGSGVRFPKIENEQELIVNYPGNEHSLTIEELIELLKNPSSDIWSNDNRAYITAFVDEFYYERNPLKENEEPSQDFKRNAWKTFTNQPDREFYIYVDSSQDESGAKYSRDRMSSFTEPLFSIRQHSIQTFYPKDLTTDPNNGEEYISMGFEKEQDPNRYMLKNIYNFEFAPEAKSFINGRKNYWSILARNDDGYQENVQFFKVTNDHRNPSGTNRLQYIEPNKYVKLAEYAKDAGLFNEFKARSACLAKNRDENGNGMLDPEEMKWYIPSLREIFTMYIADRMLPYDLRMLKNTELDAYYHYMASTTLGEYMYNTAMFWTEVGRFSRTEWDPVLRNIESGRDGRQVLNYFYGSNPTKFNDYGYPYFRCVRAMGNLKNKYTKSSYPFFGRKYTIDDYEPVTNLLEVKDRSSQKSGHGYTIRVHLADEALRSAKVTKGALPRHSQNSVWNYPYSAFEVAVECLNHNVRESRKGQIDKYLRERDEDVYWWSKKYIRNILYDDPCTYYYYEKRDKSDKGTWRMPNMRELSIMFMTLGVDADGKPIQPGDNQLESRGFRKFNHGPQYEIYDGPDWNCVYISATILSRTDDLTSPYAPVKPWRDDNNPVEYYLGYSQGAGINPVPQSELLNSNNINGYIRCVRDAE